MKNHIIIIREIGTVCLCVVLIVLISVIYRLEDKNAVVGNSTPLVVVIEVIEVVYDIEIIEVDKIARISCYIDKGTMANGEQTRHGVVAVSDRTIPLNSQVYVEGFGELKITDRTNKRIHKEFGILTIDIWMTKQECEEFGLKYLKYKLI